MADTIATELLHLPLHSDYFVMSCKQEQTSKLLTTYEEVWEIHHQIKLLTDISLSAFRYLYKPQIEKFDFDLSSKRDVIQLQRVQTKI